MKMQTDNTKNRNTEEVDTDKKYKRGRTKKEKSAINMQPKKRKRKSSHPSGRNAAIAFFSCFLLLIAVAIIVVLIAKFLLNVNITGTTASADVSGTSAGSTVNYNDDASASPTVNYSDNASASPAVNYSDDASVVSAFNYSALTLLAFVIAVWTSLNIYNTFNNQSVAEIKQKYLELNKQIRWFFFLEKVKQFSWADVSKLLPYSPEGEKKLTESMIEQLIDIAEKILKCEWEFEHCMNTVCTEHCTELLKTISENKDFKKTESLTIYLKIMVFSLFTYTERIKLRRTEKKDSRKETINTAKLESYIEEYTSIYEDYEQQSYIDDDLCQYMCLMIAYMKQLLFEADAAQNSGRYTTGEKFSDIENWYQKSISGAHPSSQCLQYYGIFLEKCKSDLEQAREKYELAMNSGDFDPKLYNLTGSLYLKLFDKENQIRTRFEKDKKLLAERTYTDSQHLVDKAIAILEKGKSAMPELTDTYANLVKAYMYKWLMKPKKNLLYRRKAYEMMSIARNLSTGRVVLFAERNLYEADRKYQRAMRQNDKIAALLSDSEDVLLARKLYSSRLPKCSSL